MFFVFTFPYLVGGHGSQKCNLISESICTVVGENWKLIFFLFGKKNVFDFQKIVMWELFNILHIWPIFMSTKFCCRKILTELCRNFVFSLICLTWMPLKTLHTWCRVSVADCLPPFDSKLQPEKMLSDRSLIWMSDLDYFYICKTLNLSLSSCSAKYFCKYTLFHLVGREGSCKHRSNFHLIDRCTYLACSWRYCNKNALLNLL